MCISTSIFDVKHWTQYTTVVTVHLLNKGIWTGSNLNIKVYESFNNTVDACWLLVIFHPISE